MAGSDGSGFSGVGCGDADRSSVLGSGASSEAAGALRLTTLTYSSFLSGGCSEPKESSMSRRSAGIRTARLMASVRRPTPMLSCSTLEVAGTGLRRRQSLVAAAAGQGAKGKIRQIVGRQTFNKCGRVRRTKWQAEAIIGLFANTPRGRSNRVRAEKWFERTEPGDQREYGEGCQCFDDQAPAYGRERRVRS